MKQGAGVGHCTLTCGPALTAGVSVAAESQAAQLVSGAGKLAGVGTTPTHSEAEVLSGEETVVFFL